MVIKYPNLLKEIIFNSDTGRDLLDFGGMSEDELIGILTGEKSVTVGMAVQIKSILCLSELPLEELFKESE